MKAPSKIALRSIPAGEFKAKCLRLMDEALVTQEPFCITKRGRVVGRYQPEPVEAKPFRSFIGRTSGAKILGDITRPMEWTDDLDKWDRLLAGKGEGKKKRKKRK